MQRRISAGVWRGVVVKTRGRGQAQAVNTFTRAHPSPQSANDDCNNNHIVVRMARCCPAGRRIPQCGSVLEHLHGRLESRSSPGLIAVARRATELASDTSAAAVSFMKTSHGMPPFTKSTFTQVVRCENFTTESWNPRQQSESEFTRLCSWGWQWIIRDQDRCTCICSAKKALGTFVLF